MLWETYLAFVTVCIVAIIVPGPTNALIMTNGMRHGLRAGMMNVAGTQIGLALMLAVVGLGLSSVIAVAGQWFEWLRLVGAAFLIWIGWRMIRGARHAAEGTAPANTPKGGFLLQGLTVALANPKQLLFFGALMPQFVDHGGDPLLQIALLGATRRAHRQAASGLTSPHDPYTRTLLASVPRLGAPGPATGRPEVADRLVEIDALDVSFQTRRGWLRTAPLPAVTGVSLVLHRGDTVALVGESGCGKTTLGRATLRLVPPTAGRVVFDGTDVRPLRGRALKAFRRRAQLIPQDPYASISPYMRVGHVVEEPLLVHGNGSRAERSRVVADALAAVGLPPEFGEAYPHTLSGGQRQRVVVARALTLDPDYLVADEPVSMIDASARGELLALLRRIQQQRTMAMLLITHDIASATQVADRVVVMYRGRVVEEGTVERVIAEPLHPYTRALIDAVPEPDPANRHRQRHVVEGEPPDPTAQITGCPFHPRCPVMIRGVCDTIEPMITSPFPGRSVACHLYPEPTAPSTNAQRNA
jgi:oligopeptide/dipeptide ABC transporter ATP-binding protein